MLNVFFSESAFQNASTHLDRLLTQPDGLRLCSTFSTSNIDHSILLGQFTSRTNPPTAQTHRPNSTIFAEDSPKRNGIHNGDEAGNGLTHVVKSRPAPPRKLKTAVNSDKFKPIYPLFLAKWHSSTDRSNQWISG